MNATEVASTPSNQLGSVFAENEKWDVLEIAARTYLDIGP